MKNLITKALIVVAMSLTLVACKEDKNTIDMTDGKYGITKEEVQSDLYGPVIADPGVVTEMNVKRATFGDGISGIVITARKPNPQVIALMCENRTNYWAINHSVRNMDGSAGVESANAKEEATGAQVSIYNLPKGTTTIREQFEYITPIMATANGQSRLGDVLNHISKLDRESLISFAFELPENTPEGEYSVVKGWSMLFKAGDLADALKTVNHSDCNNVVLADGETEIIYTPIEDILAEAKRLRGM